MRREPLIWHLWAASVLLGTAALFYLPALERTAGVWPAPLDDVYIYYGYARSLALGEPFAWFPGNGYSSGATSMLYPLLLAPAWALGLRGSALGIAAAAVALVALFDLCRSLRALMRDRAASWLVPPLLVCVPLLDWSWLSGMETALFGAVLGRCLLSALQALSAPAHRRRNKQWAAGAWLALLTLTRPEAIAFALPLAVAMTYGARSLGTWSSLARTLAPLALTLAVQALLNRTLTGEWAQAGAVRKLIFSTPYTDAATGGVAVLTNAVVLVHQAFIRGLGGVAGIAAVSMLIAAAIVSRRTRALALPLALGAAGGLLLICLNSTARFQNYRYAAPVLAMLVCAAALGAGALCISMRRRGAGRAIAMALAALLLLSTAPQLDRQVDHFARASGNIIGQQAEVALRLRALDPVPRRVMVGDAGVIPYLSELPPLDGLGLGGFRGLPFARASVHGLPAVVELIERLPAEDRPDVMALYPSWWGGVADVFGHKLDAVRIEDNVICGADEKVIYGADWSALAAHDAHLPGQIDELDVADMVSERAHDYRFPAPHGGWIVANTLRDGRGQARYDAGRIIPAGKWERYRLPAELLAGRATLRLRSDSASELTVRLVRGGVVEERTLSVVAGGNGAWLHADLPFTDVRPGDELELGSERGAWRSFHIWLLR
jgi:hypothetical protein